MLSINTNISSLIAQNSMKTSTNKLNQAIERMTTGAKINHAKDNAANYSINTNMTTKIGAYNVAADNVAMGMDMITTADETLGTISDKLSRLRALIVTAQNGTYGEQSLIAMEQEAEALVNEIQRNYSNTSYNGVSLFETKKISLNNFENLERVSEAEVLEENKAYRIDDYEDLVALQDYVNNGGNTKNRIFEVTSDINMKDREFRGIGIDSKSFQGVFNGNGHVIKNLKINIDENYVGLFGLTSNASINSIGLENCDINGLSYVGGLAGQCYSTKISDCYVTGECKALNQYCGGAIGYILSSEIKNLYSKSFVKCDNNYAGGLIGIAHDTNLIENCYSVSKIEGASIAGGLLGSLATNSVLKNSYAYSVVNGKNYVGGLLGLSTSNSVVISNYCISNVSGINSCGSFSGSDYSDNTTGSDNYCVDLSGLPAYGSGAFTGVEIKTKEELEAICSPEIMGFTEENDWKIVDGGMHLAWEAVANLPIINLQVGVSSSDSSNISFKMGFNLSGLNDILDFGLTNKNTLNIIDDLMSRVSEKQTEYGAITNRLESVLDEISIKHDNLVASRSTIRDTDMAEVSSQYIQQQILQQASATLLSSTKNIQYQNVLGLLQSLRG